MIHTGDAAYAANHIERVEAELAAARALLTCPECGGENRGVVYHKVHCSLIPEDANGFNAGFAAGMKAGLAQHAAEGEG